MNHLPDYLDSYTSDIGIAHIVELREYNPRYKEIFVREYDRLISALGGLGVSLHHVGSTSVEGLCAKPIIDMLLTYPRTTRFDDVKNVLVWAGYTFREDLLPNRTYFVLENNEGIRFFAISVFTEEDKKACDMLTFRDNLRGNHQLMAEYAAIKKELALGTSDRKLYTAKKAEFVDRYSQVLNG